MQVTYNIKLIGQDKTSKMSAFAGKEVEILNPYKMLDNQTFKSLTVFHTKKLAIEFCKRWNFNKSLIKCVESRFQKGWIIGLGRDLYAPDLAEGMLFANAIGGVIESIVDERMWLKVNDF